MFLTLVISFCCIVSASLAYSAGFLLLAVLLLALSLLLLLVVITLVMSEIVLKQQHPLKVS